MTRASELKRAIADSAVTVETRPRPAYVPPPGCVSLLQYRRLMVPLCEAAIHDGTIWPKTPK